MTVYDENGKITTNAAIVRVPLTAPDRPLAYDVTHNPQITAQNIMAPVPPQATAGVQHERLFILELQQDVREILADWAMSGTQRKLADLDRKITGHIEAHKRRMMGHYREQIGDGDDNTRI